MGEPLVVKATAIPSLQSQEERLACGSAEPTVSPPEAAGRLSRSSSGEDGNRHSSHSWGRRGKGALRRSGGRRPE